MSQTLFHTQRQQWLKEALEALSAQPSETEMMKAALTILKVVMLLYKHLL